MKLFRVALAMAGLFTTQAVAAGSLWHRSAVLDYSVAADGRATATEIWEVRADTNAIAQTIAQQTYSYVADLEQVDLVTAYTRKKDGRVVPVSAGSVMDKAVATTASAPQFSALTARTILFPQVSAGDTVHYELRRTTKETMFPGQFTLSLQPGGTATTERADISIALPPGMTLTASAVGLDEEPTEPQPGGGVVRRWRRSSTSPGTIAINASTFPDYAAVGQAYAERAAPASRPGEGVRALADRLVPAGIPQRDAVMRLYRYVASEIRYVAIFLGEGRVVPRDAKTVLAEGWGDCKDHAALLQALLAAKGIEAEPALISLQNRYDLPPAPGLSALDHVITYVPSLDLFLDSTAPYAPFGLLLASEYDKPVVLAGGRPLVAHTPPMPPTGMTLTQRTDAEIADDGGISGRTTTIASGPQSIVLRSMAAWFEGRGTAYAANAQLQQLGTPGTGRYAFESPDTGNDDGTADYRVEGRFTLDDKLMDGGAAAFPVPNGLGVFGRPGKLLVSAALTDDGGHACYPGREIEEIALELPPGATLSDMPQDVAAKAGGASYSARYAATEHGLLVHREFRLETTHQLCTEEEFDLMRPVLDLARHDQRAQLSLVRNARQLVAKAPDQPPGITRPTRASP